MIDFATFYQRLAKDRLSQWLTVLPAQLHAWQHAQQHGDLPRWQRVLAKFEGVQAHYRDLKSSVTLGLPEELPEGERTRLENLLQHLHRGARGPITCLASILIPNGAPTGSGIACYRTSRP